MTRTPTTRRSALTRLAAAALAITAPLLSQHAAADTTVRAGCLGPLSFQRVG